MPVFTQLPLHADVPAAHAHDPLVHTRPPGHTLPHDPQLLASVCGSTQVVTPPVEQVIRGAEQLA